MQDKCVVFGMCIERTVKAYNDQLEAHYKSKCVRLAVEATSKLYEPVIALLFYIDRPNMTKDNTKFVRVDVEHLTIVGARDLKFLAKMLVWKAFKEVIGDGIDGYSPVMV